MSMPVEILPIRYLPDASFWLKQIRHLGNAVWLDSCAPQSEYGRFDILSASPSTQFKTDAEGTRVLVDKSAELTQQNPFDLLKSYLVPTEKHLQDIPFCGGLLGYFGYDLGHHQEKIDKHSLRDIHLPDMLVGLYPWAIIQDHLKQLTWLVINPVFAPAYNFLQIKEICQNATKEPLFHDLNKDLKSTQKPFKISEFESELNVASYTSSITKIKDYINAGDCYQVNFTQRFSATCEGDPLDAYLKLRTKLPSPFSAFYEFDKGCILSISPERFIKVDNRLAETKPIKGTIARGTTLVEDEAAAKTLTTSLKDRAENLMIVDLLRNDLSRTCTNIRVPELFSLQSFTNVHHLVSTVCGEVKPELNALDVLAKSFPGGSITGAPKIRAMEIIEELEPVGRSVYCGSLGYISACGNMDTSIAIRTLVCNQGKIYCWGGGGIVADSQVEQEYTESITKVKLLMDTLENYFGSPLKNLE